MRAFAMTEPAMTLGRSHLPRATRPFVGDGGSITQWPAPPR